MQMNIEQWQERGINDNRSFYWRKRLSEPMVVGRFVQGGKLQLVAVEPEDGLKVRCRVEPLRAVLDVLGSRCSGGIFVYCSL